MAIELVKGGSVTCVDNNYNVTYNGTPLKRIYACDTVNNVCTLVYCKNQLTVTYNYCEFDGVADYHNYETSSGWFSDIHKTWVGCLLHDEPFGDYIAHVCYTLAPGNNVLINTYVTGTLPAPQASSFTDSTPDCTGLSNGYCYCIYTCNLFKTPTFCFLVQSSTCKTIGEPYACECNIDYTSDTKSIIYCDTSITNPADYTYVGSGGISTSPNAMDTCVMARRDHFETGVDTRYAIVCVCDTTDGTVKCYCCPIGTSAGSITVTTDF